MVYVISNLYGDYNKYEAILKEIKLKDDDMLFVLGNIVDGGDKGVEILMDMMMRGNVFPVLGDHELIAYEILSSIEKETREDFSAPLSEEVANRCQRWMESGGEGTLTGYSKLSDDDKIALIEYLEEFTIYEEVEAGGEKFVLCYSLPENFEEGDQLDDYSAEDILTGSVNYERNYFPGKTLITSKDITIEIDRNTHGKIFRNDCHVGINCGGYLGGLTAAYCLDTDEEYYVE
ncbi:MAG: metallophosphoesterase [Clostridia bacterium]